jgi:hypothetical protein
MISNHPFGKYEIWKLHTKYHKDLYPIVKWHGIYFDQKIYLYSGSLTPHHWHLQYVTYSGNKHNVQKYPTTATFISLLLDYTDCMITLCWFQQIKQVTTLSSFVKITITNAFWMNWDLPLLLGIPLILEPILHRMKFFKIIFLF